MKQHEIWLAISTYCVLIASVIAGQHLISLFGVTVSSGMFIFPFTYVLIALMAELNGARAARRVIVYCAIANAIMLCLICAVLQVPSEKSSLGSAEVYDLFLSRFAFVLMVSTLAFSVSEYVNVFMLSALKIFTKGKFFLQRVFCSTVCAIVIDTIIVFPFYATRQSSMDDALFEAGCVLLIKVLVDVAFLPLCGLLSNLLRNTHERELPPSALPFTSMYYLKQVREVHE